MYILAWNKTSRNWPLAISLRAQPEKYQQVSRKNDVCKSQQRIYWKITRSRSWLWKSLEKWNNSPKTSKNYRSGLLTLKVCQTLKQWKSRPKTSLILSLNGQIVVASFKQINWRIRWKIKRSFKVPNMNPAFYELWWSS